MEIEGNSGCMCSVLMLIVNPGGVVTETHTCTRKPYKKNTEEYYFVYGQNIERMTTGNGKTISGEPAGMPFYEKNADLIIVFRGKFTLAQIEDFLCKNVTRRSPLNQEGMILAMLERVKASLATETTDTKSSIITTTTSEKI